MEEGDFSKAYSFKKNNFNGSLFQQGRVFIDSDFNDEVKTTIKWQDTVAIDTIGPHVAAIPVDDMNGFKVIEANLNTVEGKDTVNVTIMKGRAWVDGLLVYSHNENLNDVDTRIATYLQPPIQDPSFDTTTIGNNSDAVILEVWRESISAFQIPSDLLEPALGGPDTTERIYTATSLKLFRIDAGDTCDSVSKKLQKNDDINKGKLLVKLQDTQISNCDCPVTNAGGFTGFEHSLYRIEIADVNDKTPMFKWSQFNGGLVGRGHFDLSDPNKIIITGNLQAIKTCGLNSFYLEAKEYDKDLGHWKITFGVPVTLNNDSEFEFENSAVIFGSRPDTSKHDVFFRLWNGLNLISDFTADKELVDGIILKFDNPQPDVFYLPRDYWTFSVRVGESSLAPLIDNEPPYGIIYHRVPLAILNWDAGQKVINIDDCRHIFRPLTSLDSGKGCCCTFTVGDGKSSFGDFNSIQEAVDALNDSAGGELCILPGEHESNITMRGKNNIKIKGCGNASFIHPQRQNSEPIFNIIDCTKISIENIIFISEKGIAICMQSFESTLNEINIHQNIFQAKGHAIGVLNANNINIINNQIYLFDKEDTGVGIFMLASNSSIEKNLIEATPSDKNTISHALGGIQILGGSNGIKILQNKINGGTGNGITLSSFNPLKILGKDVNLNVDIFDNDNSNSNVSKNTANSKLASTSFLLAKPYSYFIFNILIQDNEIKNMGLCGIGSRLTYGIDMDPKVGYNNPVINLSIFHNRIFSCVQKPFTGEMLSNAIQKISVGFGGICLETGENISISNNTIENNGQISSKFVFPICGIFILFGSKVNIYHNYICNNGSLPSSSLFDTNIQPGIRGV